LATAVHEIAGHQGLRSMFGHDYAAMDAFLDRVWNGMERTGMGDEVARAAGADNVNDLARKYGLGTEQPDGTLVLSDREHRRLAEELLARYAERFDPAQLDKAPTVLQRAVGLVQDGLARFQGLEFTNDQAARFIRDAWRGTEPAKSPEVNTARLLKKILKSYEPPELERARLNEPATRELLGALRSISARPGQEPLVAGSRHVGLGDIAGSSDRVGSYARATGRVLDYSRLNERSALRLPRERDAEHEIYVPARDRNILVKVTRPDGRWGPYGPGLERIPPEEQGTAASDARTIAGTTYRLGRGTAESYLERQALSNELFGAGNHLEGFTQIPGNNLFKDALDVPFTGSELAKATREQGVKIEDLFRQHRNRIGTTIDSLSDYLAKRSNLEPQQAAAVQRAVEGHIQSQVRERIQKEFDRILDRAQQAGKPISGGRDTSLSRL
jgi:hypothetical protein